MSEHAVIRKQPVEWGLFGGAGFIGQHLAASIMSASPTARVTLLDIRSPFDQAVEFPLGQYFSEGRLSYVAVDVRNADQVLRDSGSFDVIINLAAIHREPGHRSEEYFETNVAGAENVCNLASETGCREIIFTSSIAVYGVHDRPLDEEFQVQPKTPYGQSKLRAEEIHKAWAKERGNRLSIIRPGVVFGRGENGNVTRLVREMLKRGRAIRLEPDQPKAGIYIEELLSLVHWLRTRTLGPGGCQLVNAVSNEHLSFNDFGKALQNIRQFTKKPLRVTATFLRTAVFLARPLALVLPGDSKIHPDRLAKLTRANDIRSNGLAAMGYPFAWTLEDALKDWLAKGL